ncbi:YihY/virulence factor BrkB family protein [Methylobacterium sp. J-067]|uniref:YihY/virulence factor BrkB family protein n=1 Tax=Methylobacterium sp. J-067 TaxID=2836648 RepID=UPI001FBB4601|nr:YihY/virulence factor BrkB family protein [Methylobacterium sp. J-067]MCJ2027159.1 YihY/virulence factor BrkB family protein [Methylobacterium sp. J-067]
MPDSPSPRHDGTTGAASLIWTLGLATALVGLVALPRTRTPRPREGDAREPSPSHSGPEAEHVARTQADRGRKAATPKEIPAAGWKDILVRTWRDVGENRIMLVSAGVTFFALLAIFPAIAALVSLYGLVADTATISEQLGSLQGILPQGALDIVGEQVTRLNEKGNTTLGFSLLLGLALSLWSANGGMKHVFDALNLVYNERESRGFFTLNLVSLGFTAGALLFLLLALAGVVALPIALNFLGLGEGAWWLSQLRWPVMFLAVLLGLALLYRYGPSRDAPRWRWATPGSALAAFLWLGGSLLFSWYVGNFGKYNQTYGSLGAAIGFMTWIWISTTIVLLGAQLNAEMEHQTAEDTTVGQPQPMGTRRARMADTVGQAAE